MLVADKKSQLLINSTFVVLMPHFVRKTKTGKGIGLCTKLTQI